MLVVQSLPAEMVWRSCFDERLFAPMKLAGSIIEMVERCWPPDKSFGRLLSSPSRGSPVASKLCAARLDWLKCPLVGAIDGALKSLYQPTTVGARSCVSNSLRWI